MNSDKNDALGQFEEAIKDIHTKIEQEQQSTFAKYPLTFSLLATLGVAAVVYGFEGVVSTIPFLVDRPILIFFIGLALLLGTGRLYKQLEK